MFNVHHFLICFITLRKVHFSFHYNSVHFITATLNTIKGNWTCGQIFLCVWKFVSQMFVMKGAPILLRLPSWTSKSIISVKFLLTKTWPKSRHLCYPYPKYFFNGKVPCCSRPYNKMPWQCHGALSLVECAQMFHPPSVLQDQQNSLLHSDVLTEVAAISVCLLIHSDSLQHLLCSRGTKQVTTTYIQNVVWQVSLTPGPCNRSHLE